MVSELHPAETRIRLKTYAPDPHHRGGTPRDPDPEVAGSGGGGPPGAYTPFFSGCSEGMGSPPGGPRAENAQSSIKEGGPPSGPPRIAAVTSPCSDSGARSDPGGYCVLAVKCSELSTERVGRDLPRVRDSLLTVASPES